MKVDGGISFDPSHAIRSAQEAEAAGYDGAWTAETSHDPFLACLLAAEHTERLEVGTAIAVAFARSPMTTAQTANDLQQFSEGRFLLGLGSQIKPHIEKRFSMPWSKPAARMREYVSAMRAIWASWHEGTKLDFRGDFYQHTLMTPFFNPGPNPHGTPKVFLAGVGELMTEVAGEVCDGFICHAFTTEQYFREVTLPALERGRAKAGKTMDGFEISGPSFVVSGSTEEEMARVAQGTREQIAFYGSTPAYQGVLDMHGWGDLHTELNALSKQGKWKEMGELIDDEVLNTFAVVGEPDQVAPMLLARYGDAVTRMSFYFPFGDADQQAAVREQLREGLTAPLEISWFAPSCWGDTARLGVDDPARRATFEYNARVVGLADRLGFRNVLIPSSFVPGLDPWTLAAALGPTTRTTRLLPAVRVGEFDPPMLARAARGLQAMMGGRLTVNIISSDRVGESLPSDARYRRTAEAMALLKAFWSDDHVAFDGEWYRYDVDTLATRTRTPPPLYFGGTSEPARDAAAAHADVYLMWVETVASTAELVADLRRRAGANGRTLRFGLRTHVIVRETEAQARRAAAELVSELDPDVGRRLKESTQDHASEGVRRQDALRAASGDDGFVEDHLWTGIGVARSGVGAAIVGDPDQVEAKLRAYADLGIESFILSGYPLDDEAERVAELVLPRFELGSLAAEPR